MPTQRKTALPIELGKKGALDKLNALCQDSSASVNSSSSRELLTYESGAVQTRVVQALETCVRKYPFKTITLDEAGNKALVRASEEVEAVFDGDALFILRLEANNMVAMNAAVDSPEYEEYEAQKTGFFDFLVRVDSMPLTENGQFACELLDEQNDCLDAAEVPMNPWDIAGDTGVQLRRYVYSFGKDMDIVHVVRIVDEEAVSLDAELEAD